jgi:hypothetical protein
VSVPLSVEAEGWLFLRTVTDSGNKHRLAVPAGRYDMVARFFRPRRTGGDSLFDSWRVVLTFLPRGTVGAGCLKLDGDPPPTAVVLHE